MLEQLKNQWQQRAKHEKNFIAGIIILIIIFIAWFFWLPLVNGVDIKYAQSKQEAQNLAWFRNAAARIQAYQHDGLNVKKLIAMSKQKKTDKDILALAKKSLRTSGLGKFITSNKPITQNNQGTSSKESTNKSYIALEFKEVPFTNLIKWLQTIWRNEHIALTAITLKKSNAQGTADVNLQLGS